MRPALWVVSAALILQALVIIVMGRFDPIAVSILATGLILCAALFTTVSRVLGLLVALVMILQAKDLVSPFMPVWYDPRLILMLMGVAYFYMVRDRFDSGELSWPAPGFGRIWAALSVWLIVVALWGLLRDARFVYWFGEVTYAMFYSTLILAAHGLRRRSDFHIIFWALLLGMAGVFLQYVASVLVLGQAGLQVGRIVTRQANLVVAVAPFLVGIFLIHRRWAWLAAAGLVPLLVVVLLSQQRALFIALPVCLGVPVVLGFRAPGVQRSRVLRLCLAMVGAGLVAWLVIGPLSAMLGGSSIQEDIAERTQETSEVTGTASVAIRLISYAYIWQNKVAQRPVAGRGPGDTENIPILRGSNMRMIRVDNSYITLLWKSGIVGLVLFLLLYAIALRRTLALTRHPHPDVQILAMGVAGALSAVLVLSLASSLMTHYRFNVIWGIFFGAVAVAERVYGKLPDGEKKTIPTTGT